MTTPKIETIPTSYATALKQASAAQERLYDNTDDLPRWPWDELHDLCGPPLPGDLTIIGARTKNGKTTFVLNVFDHFVRAGYPTLYIGAGAEGPPEDSRRQWAALRCGYPGWKVMENAWRTMEEGARDKIFAEIQRAAVEDHDVAFFADVQQRLTKDSLVAALKTFNRAPNARYVILDHIHRLRMDTAKDQRLEIADAIRWLRDIAAKYSWSLIVAAQLHRAPSQHGNLRDLMPPTMNDLKETGALEEEAVVGLLLHRVKSTTVDGGQVQAVARGERPITDIMEPQCMAVRIGAHRRRGHVMDNTTFLHVSETGQLTQRAPVWRTAPSGSEDRYDI